MPFLNKNNLHKFKRHTHTIITGMSANASCLFNVKYRPEEKSKKALHDVWSCPKKRIEIKLLSIFQLNRPNDISNFWKKILFFCVSCFSCTLQSSLILITGMVWKWQSKSWGERMFPRFRKKDVYSKQVFVWVIMANAVKPAHSESAIQLAQPTRFVYVIDST